MKFSFAIISDLNSCGIHSILFVMTICNFYAYYNFKYSTLCYCNDISIVTGNALWKLHSGRSAEADPLKTAVKGNFERLSRQSPHPR